MRALDGRRRSDAISWGRGGRDYIEGNSIPVPFCGCWFWIAGMNSNGYARVLISGRKQYIHRVSYEAYKGSIAPGLVVRHSCDTPCCVNPDHLSVGTHVDNAMDMVSRGRSMKGRQAGPNWRRKLTADQVYEAMASRESDAATGRRFGVAKGVIRHLRIGKTYRELTRSAA